MDGVVGTGARTAFLPVAAPTIGPHEIGEVVAALRSDWLTTGPRVKQFEAAFCEYVHAPAALAVSSCTAALHLSLVCLGVGPGDWVVTSPMTFCSAVNVIEHIGARPVMVDVEPDTLNIAPGHVAAALAAAARGGGSTPNGDHAAARRPRVILPVHLYGHPCDMDALRTVAAEHGADIVEDAAHALSARYGARGIGPDAHESPSPDGRHPRIMACYSFYATKNLTTGEGGMLTGPPEMVERARVLSLHGMSRDAWKRYSAQGSWYYEVVAPGFKYNMTDLQAALGLQQLRRLPLLQARRRAIVSQYNAAFAEFDALELPVERPGVEHAWYVYVLRLRTDRLRFPGHDASALAIRARFIEELRHRQIGTSVHFIPVHVHPYYRDKYGYRPEDFPVAYDAYTRMLSLPLFPRMTDADVGDVIDAVAEIVRRYRR